MRSEKGPLVQSTSNHSEGERRSLLFIPTWHLEVQFNQESINRALWLRMEKPALHYSKWYDLGETPEIDHQPPPSQRLLPSQIGMSNVNSNDFPREIGDFSLSLNITINRTESLGPLKLTMRLFSDTLLALRNNLIDCKTQQNFFAPCYCLGQSHKELLSYPKTQSIRPTCKGS